MSFFTSMFKDCCCGPSAGSTKAASPAPPSSTTDAPSSSASNSSSAASVGLPSTTPTAVSAAGPPVPTEAGKHHMLHVSIIQARALQAVDKKIFAKNSSDPYIKLFVTLRDGSVVGGQTSKVFRNSLSPIFHFRTDTSCGTIAPASITVEILDHNRVRENKSLGRVTYPITGAHYTASPPTDWLKLEGVPTGDVQVQVAGNLIDAISEEEGGTASEFARAVGLISLKLEDLHNLSPGPKALARMARAKFDEGSFQLSVVLQHGEKNFKTRPVPNARCKNASSTFREEEAIAGKHAADRSPDHVQQEARIWVSGGQEAYKVRVSVFAFPAGAAATTETKVLIGRGYLDTAVLTDHCEHAYRVYLHEEDEETKLTDASQSSLIETTTRKGVALASTSPAFPSTSSSSTSSSSSSSSSNSSASSSSDAAPIHRTNSIGVTRSLTTSSKHPAIAAAAAAEAERRAAAASAGEADDLIDEHTSGLRTAAEFNAKTEAITYVGRLNVHAIFESKSELENFFYEKLLQEFDSDGSGALDHAELIAMMGTLGVAMNAADYAELLRRLDPSGSGNVAADAVLQWFHSPEFARNPLSATLLDFLASGPDAVKELIVDVTHFIKGADQDEVSRKKRGEAKNLTINDGEGKPTVADRGLKIYDRKSGLLVDEHIPTYVLVAINAMYHSAFGSFMANTGMVRSMLRSMSHKEGLHMDKPESRGKILPFIEEHNLNVAEMDKLPSEYANFNDFFARKLKAGARPITAPFDDDIVTSPADARMVVYENINEATDIWVKGASFTVEGLLGPENADVASLFIGGSFCIARLAPQDYHRWHLPVSGRLGKRSDIEGALYTVNPIAIRRPKPDVYSQNQRKVLIVQTPSFGTVAMVAVGATIVGSINIDLEDKAFGVKGEGHGFFKFGGSTVLVLFQPGSIVFDEDLVKNSREPLETYVRVGDKIGRAAVPRPAHIVGVLPDTDPDYIAYRARAAAAAAAAAAGATAGANEASSGANSASSSSSTSSAAPAATESSAATATSAAAGVSSDAAVTPATETSSTV